MPMRHKYLIVSSINQEQNLDIKKLFLGRFKILMASCDEIPKLIYENENDIAGVILDDSQKNEDILSFLKISYEENFHEKIPMFLLYDLVNDHLYVEAIRYGIDEVIRKPYLPDILQKRVYHITELFNHKYRLEWLVDTQTRELKESIQVLEDMQIQVLEALGTLVEFRNLESGEHVYRVRFITDVLMHELQERYPKYGISHEMIVVTDMASILHDIGKIMISDTILNKPAKLSLEEFEEMKLHTYYGCEILDKLRGLYNENTYHFYKDIICYHHEKYDGRGYPEGLKGDEIPIWSQIVSLADVYDALTNERVYKKAFSHEVAMKMIFEGECGSYNPDVLDCFQHVQEDIRQTALQSHNKEQEFTTRLIPQKRNHILNDYEKERAFHSAYQELITDYFFEYDIEYGMVRYFNAFGKINEERYALEEFPGMNKTDEESLKKAIEDSSPDNPLIHLTVDMNEKGVHRRCELTLRTTWNMYTGECIGGVGKLEFIG